MTAEKLPGAPKFKNITFGTVKKALNLGLEDMFAAKGYGFLFTLPYVLGGLVFTYITWTTGESYWLVFAAVGFPLLGPFASVGFYEVSRRRENGLPMGRKDILSVVTSQRTGQLPWLSAVIIMIVMFWFFLGHMIFALFLGLALILAAFSLRNYIKEGKFDFKSDSAAISFAQAQETGIGETKILDDMGFNPFKDGNLRNSLRVFINQPVRTSSLLLTSMYEKGRDYLFVSNFGEMDFLTLLNPSGVGPGYRFPLYAKFYIHLLILIGLAKFALKKEFRLERSILLGYIGYAIFIYASIMTRNARYRAVLEPLFIILFACGVHWIFKRFKMVLVQGKN